MRTAHAILFSTVIVAFSCAREAPRDQPRRSETPAAPTTLPEGAEAISLLGDTLVPPTLPDSVLAERMERYFEAEDALAANPESADALIRMGRQTAYLGRYGDAIDIYSYAIDLHPEDPRLYRHRGHRYLTIRKLGEAVADLQRAAELTEGKPDEAEPDGLPNAEGIFTSTLQFNIWYHLGLAYYLKGDWAAAAAAYTRCAQVSLHPDSKVATAYWQVMTLKRLGRVEEAQAVLAEITPGMDVIESGGYLGLLLLHKGERRPEDVALPVLAAVTLESATAGYGVGAWYLLTADTARAVDAFGRVLTGRDQWAAFGYIAAEAELARLGT